MENHKFLAGAARVDITPPMGTILGVDMFPHYARFIHDPLHVKALVLTDGKIIVAIVIVDTCIMGTDFMDDIKGRIQKETGIQPENVLLASNHDHGAGNVVGLLGGAVDIEYRNKLPNDELLYRRFRFEIQCIYPKFSKLFVEQQRILLFSF